MALHSPGAIITGVCRNIGYVSRAARRGEQCLIDMIRLEELPLSSGREKPWRPSDRSASPAIKWFLPSRRRPLGGAARHRLGWLCRQGIDEPAVHAVWFWAVFPFPYETAPSRYSNTVAQMIGFRATSPSRRRGRDLVRHPDRNQLELSGTGGGPQPDKIRQVVICFCSACEATSCGTPQTCAGPSFQFDERPMIPSMHECHFFVRRFRRVVHRFRHLAVLFRDFGRDGRFCCCFRRRCRCLSEHRPGLVW